MQRPSYILPFIIFSQFAGTSLWFAGNAILPELQLKFKLDEHAIGSITTAVQLGFITGTFVFALLAIADRFRPSLVFFISSLLAATANMLVVVLQSAEALLLLRFLTGFFLAGIYPVGMKIAADWYEKGLGRALGYLVGALVLGTAFPHLLRAGNFYLPWKQALIATSICAALGGSTVLLFIPDGPFRKTGSRFRPAMMLEIFRSKNFRSAAFGYFGHMWELYTLWAFVPLLVKLHNQSVDSGLNIPLISFITIAMGSPGCVLGGLLSVKTGSAKIAFYALACSAACCVLSPFMIHARDAVFIFFLLIWGISVAADSPQFSALVAATAPSQQKGTALTLVTCIGFAITILSIFIFDRLLSELNIANDLFALLAVGPVLGLISLWKMVK